MIYKFWSVMPSIFKIYVEKRLSEFWVKVAQAVTKINQNDTFSAPLNRVSGISGISTYLRKYEMGRCNTQ